MEVVMTELNDTLDREEEADIAQPEEDEREKIAKQNAEHAKLVQNAAMDLRNGFGTGKAFKKDAFLRKIVNALFVEEMGIIDFSDTEKNIDAVFLTTLDYMVDNVDEIIDGLSEKLKHKVKSIAQCTTRRVTLRHGMPALDMAKAYVNYKPSTKLVDATYFNCVG
jgi:hypothetical protein